MAQEQWKKNQPGCESCCGDTSCRPYLPCCLRDLECEVDFFITEEDDGPLATAVVERMTVTNESNGQRSVDWSTWNALNNDLAGGQVRATFGGRRNQGCTFGIDVSLEDLFCPVIGGGPNFTIRVRIQNTDDKPIDVEMRQPSFALSFVAVNTTFCPIQLLSADTELRTNIDVGDTHEFVMTFGVADWTECHSECVTPGPAVILKGAGYLNDNFDSTCLRPILCVGSAPNSGFVGTDVGVCTASECPPCGCILDALGGCACGCNGVEPMNNCGKPKKVTTGSTSRGGTVVLCNSQTRGHAPLGTFIECRDDNGKLAAEIKAPTSGGFTWQYVIHSDPPGTGVTVSVNEQTLGITIPNCTDYAVTWGTDDGLPFLEVDGNRVDAFSAPTNAVISDTCHIVARGSVFNAT